MHTIKPKFKWRNLTEDPFNKIRTPISINAQDRTKKKKSGLFFRFGTLEMIFFLIVLGRRPP